MIAWSCADGDNVIVVVHERVERVDIAGDLLVPWQHLRWS